MHGTAGDLDLSLAEKLVLAIGGTLGVVGFVGLPAVALHRTGFRLRPRLHARDERLKRLMNLSGWAVLQHAGIGILLGASIVMGNVVAGGVVAYQFAFVLFLAPYAILAHPVQTTILPVLTLDAKRNDLVGFARGVRISLDRLAILVVPVSAAFVALAVPAMRAITVHNDASVELLAAALAGLGIGLLPYSVFLLFARALYALDDSRTPGGHRARHGLPRRRVHGRGRQRRPRQRPGPHARARAQPGVPAGRALPRLRAPPTAPPAPVPARAADHRTRSPSCWAPRRGDSSG